MLFGIGSKLSIKALVSEGKIRVGRVTLNTVLYSIFSPTVQNQQFTELRQKLGIYIQNASALVWIANTNFLLKKEGKMSANLGTDRL